MDKRSWYAFVQGQRHGPVGLEVLRDWAARGYLGSADLVWTEGMATWLTAGEVAEVFGSLPKGEPAAGGAATPTSGAALVPVPPPGGTGGLAPNSRLTAAARSRLRGQWGIAVAFAFLYMLVTGAVTSLSQAGLSLAVAIGPPLDTLRGQVVFVLLTSVALCIPLVVMGSFLLGQIGFFLSLARGGEADIGMIFRGFRHFARSFWVFNVVMILVSLWAMAAAVPGVLAGLLTARYAGSQAGWAVGLIAGEVLATVASIVSWLAYSQALYLLADDTRLRTMEAVRRSVRLMRGRKLKLFLLGLRFLGWMMLASLPLWLGIGWLVLGTIRDPAAVAEDMTWVAFATLMGLGIVSGFVGNLFIVPYANTSYACFYDDLPEPPSCGDGRTDRR